MLQATPHHGGVLRIVYGGGGGDTISSSRPPSAQTSARPGTSTSQSSYLGMDDEDGDLPFALESECAISNSGVLGITTQGVSTKAGAVLSVIGTTATTPL